MPQGSIALQDFIAGQEASIKQYGLDSSAGSQGLQVQMQLHEGSARVHALIQQELDLVKQELLSARLRSPGPLNPTGILLLLLPDLVVPTKHYPCSSLCFRVNHALSIMSMYASCHWCFCGIKAQGALLLTE